MNLVDPHGRARLRRVGRSVVAVLLLSVIGVIAAPPASALSSFDIQIRALGPVLAGSSVELEVTVFNNGPDQSTNTTLDVTLPAGITPAGSNQTCIAPSSCLLGSFGAINSQNTATGRLGVDIDPDYVVDNGAGTAFGTAAFQIGVDYTGGSQTATRRLVVGESSDLRVRKYVNPATANAGQQVSYQIDVDNLGPSTARGVVVKDALFGGVGQPGALVQVQSCAFSVSQGGGAISQFTCTTGPVIPSGLGQDLGTFGTDVLQPVGLYPGAPNPVVGGRLRASFLMTTNEANTFTNEVRVLASTFDPDQSNNIATAAHSFTAVADLGITMSASAASADPGALVTYTLTATNNGPSDATNVLVKDYLPAGVDFVSATTPGGTCLAGAPGHDAHPVTCLLGTIGRPSGGVAQSEVITVVARVPASGRPGAGGVNQAWVASETPDLNNANDAAEATLVVSVPDRLFNPVTPSRQFDTRDGTGGVPVGKVAGGSSLQFTVTGVNGVPAGATAVALNVTVDGPDADGWITVYPCAAAQPLTSNVNYVLGKTASNAVIAPVDAAGKVCFATSASTHIISDVSGWFRATDGLTTVTPVREFDSRDGTGGIPVGKREPGSVLTFKVTGVNGVPANNVSAVALNVTVDQADAGGFVNVFPCGAQPVTSSLNFVPGQTVPNLVVAPVSPQGTVCFYTNARTHLLADLSGWFATGSDLGTLNPSRVFDTRNGLGGVPAARLLAGGSFEVDVTGRNGVPETGVSAVVLNVTVTGPSNPGFVTVFPCGNRPLTSNVNFEPGRTVPNAVIAPVSATGTVCFYANAETDLLADVSGWFA